jgi:hypothetical protein
MPIIPGDHETLHPCDAEPSWKKKKKKIAWCGHGGEN